jgi:CheY-like chemotaxis protein
MPASPTILVVDDSPFAARALVHVLETRGLRARGASSMEEATRICTEYRPSVLVSDVCMPNLDLLGLCRHVRAAARGRPTAVLLVSAHSEGELRDVLAATGADAFIEKRHGAASVAAKVEALCRIIANGPTRHPLPSSPG